MAGTPRDSLDVLDVLYDRDGGRRRPPLAVRPSPRQQLGRYSFRLPDLPGGIRHLRDPDTPEEGWTPAGIGDLEGGHHVAAGCLVGQGSG